MNKPERVLGPNAKKLLIRFMARLTVPPGSGMQGVITTIVTPGRLSKVAGEALEQMDIAILAMRSAPDNPYGDDEEAICGGILAEVEKRK